MAYVKQFTFNPFYENSYVVYDDSKECIIIDPGCIDQSEKRDLTNFIKEQQLIPQRLINTHCHIDHIFGNQFISAAYNLELEANFIEEANIKEAANFAMALGVPDPNSPLPSKNLEGGGNITFGNTNLQILFTPGHSAGHVTLFSKPDRFAISADVLFMGGIGRTDLPGGDFDTLIRTIKEQLYPLGDDVTIFPGHGPETTIGREKQSNPFLT